MQNDSGAHGSAPWLALGIAAAAGAAGTALWLGQNRDRIERPKDDAPARTSTRERQEHTVVGRTVTINRPRQEVYAFWREFSNLPKFMENVRAVTPAGNALAWEIAAPAGTTVTLVTEIAEDRPGELIAWASTDASDVTNSGRISFRDAQGGRGTIVEAEIAYDPPAGQLGRLIASLFMTEPAIQGRRELKRLKMLLETGEIAVSRNHRRAAKGRGTQADDRDRPGSTSAPIRATTEA